MKTAGSRSTARPRQYNLPQVQQRGRPAEATPGRAGRRRTPHFSGAEQSTSLLVMRRFILRAPRGKCGAGDESGGVVGLVQSSHVLGRSRSASVDDWKGRSRLRSFLADEESVGTRADPPCVLRRCGRDKRRMSAHCCRS